MKKENKKPTTEKLEIAGHTVEIRKIDDREELYIDGTRRKFFQTKDGYTLHVAAYERPYKSLRDAAADLLKRKS